MIPSAQPYFKIEDWNVYPRLLGAVRTQGLFCERTLSEYQGAAQPSRQPTPASSSRRAPSVIARRGCALRWAHARTRHLWALFTETSL